MQGNRKKWLLPLFVLFVCQVCSHAQTSGQNYILTRTMKDSTGNTFLEKIQYYDGLGRPVQTVEKGIALKGNDLVTLQEYDNFGRESNLWLPVPYPGNGNYVNPTMLDSIAKQSYGDNAPYSHPIYESSPLNRILEKYGPGQNWQSNNRSVRTDFLTNNNLNDSLRCACYSVSPDGKLEKTGNYDNCQLYVTCTLDEDNHVVYEFKNKQGQVVLTRQINYKQNHDTYYVHDDFGNLHFVLPPMATDVLTADKVYEETEDALQKYAYIYRYDSRNRCIWKKLPGAGGISMVYDKTDHLIFLQDGEQSKRNEWTFSIPDIFGRIVMTGTYKGDAIDVSNLAVSAPTVNGYGFMNTGYLTPNFTLTNCRMLIVNYYDNYNFMNLMVDSVKAELNYLYLGGYASQYKNSIPSISANGLLTGTRIYELSNPDSYKVQTYYYDNRGQVAQTRSTNFFGGYDFVYNSYSFTGKVEKTHKTHTANLITYPVNELYKNYYDHADRLLTTSYTLNNNPEVLLVENDYDDFGRLTTKYRHNRTDTIYNEYNIRNWVTRIKNGGFEEKLYYNTRPSFYTLASPCYNGNISFSSWMYNGVAKGYDHLYDGLNRLIGGGYCYINSELQEWSQHTESMIYDKMGNVTNLNRWDGEDILDLLTLTYNGNQLKSVNDGYGSRNRYDIKEYNNLANLETEFFYDANGNLIADLDREIVTIKYNLLNLPDTIQFRNSNQIINRYAADGTKLRTDYFTLLTPVAVPITKGEVCKWEYQLDVINQDTRMFADNYEYTFNRDPDPETHYDYYSLSRIDNSEGYAHSGANPRVYYYYYRKDHLGNNREVWRAHDKKVVQRTQYYPSGLPWGESEGANKQPYKYNGKEFIEMHGYDTYDYGARGYYPAIMRFTTVDPLAEKYYSISPYAYCGGNPVNRVDPFGMDVWSTNDPETIRMALDALKNGSDVTYNEKTWNYKTDEQFLKKGEDEGYSVGLNYSDKTGHFYQGTAISWGISIKDLGEAKLLSDPDSHYGIDGSYNQYTKNETDAAMEFYWSIAGGELGGAALGAVMSRIGGAMLGRIATKGGVELTAHGAERIAGAAATRGGVLTMEGVNTTKSLGKTFSQADGANVFLHEVTPGRFNAVIQNQTTGKVITTMNNWSQKSINRIGKNYGWPIQ
jgi:RHS repeat-associated core domain